VRSEATKPRDPEDAIRNHAASGSSHKMLILALPDSAKFY
jgi:hypothetical protein